MRKRERNKLRLVWLITISVAILDLTLFISKGLTWRRNDVGSFSFILLLLIFWALATAARRLTARNWVFTRAAVFFEALLILVLFSIGCSLLSYFVTEADFPFVDPELRAIDHALGFHWHALEAWTDGRAAIWQLLILAYESMLFQSIFILLFSVFTDNDELIADFFLMSMAAALAAAGISAVLPALGETGAIGPRHIVALLNARRGNLHALSLSDVVELVTFPSFHAAMDVIPA